MPIIVNLSVETIDELHTHLRRLLYGVTVPGPVERAPAEVDPDEARLNAELTELDTPAAPPVVSTAEAEQPRRGRGRPRKDATPAPTPAPELVDEPMAAQPTTTEAAPAEPELADAAPAPINGAADPFADLDMPPARTVQDDFKDAMRILREVYLNGGGTDVRDLLNSYKVTEANQLPVSEGTALLGVAKNLQAKHGVALV